MNKLWYILGMFDFQREIAGAIFCKIAGLLAVWSSLIYHLFLIR